jgi:Fur family ferric uptake transcriptional regulator
MMDIISDVKTKFSEYLENNNNRKTQERFAILEEIYSNQDHFDAETLYVQMKKSAYRVSRATVYNTIDVLLECKLIKKHNFGENVSFFEKTYGVKPHHHLICSKCKTIREFEDPQILELSKNVASSHDFKLEDISLNLFGICNHCMKT